MLLPVTFSFVLSFWAFPFLERIAFFKRLSFLERLVLGIAVSASGYVLLLSWYGVFARSGFSAFSTLLFYSGLLLSFWWLISFVRKMPKIKLPKLSQIEKLLIFLILVITVKIILIFILRPVIDPDITFSYLPFARSIAQLDFVPEKDLYTLNPMIIPPIGGPTLFAWTYAVSGSLSSEAFRLLTLPFLLGTALLAFLFGSRIGDRFLGLASAFVFLSLPIQDNLLLEWALYPDVIFAFLGLAIFY